MKSDLFFNVFMVHLIGLRGWVFSGPVGGRGLPLLCCADNGEGAGEGL